MAAASLAFVLIAPANSVEAGVVAGGQHSVRSNEWLNKYNKGLDFSCSNGNYITGVDSKHANHNEDRR